jgi:hypothetical protein
MAGNGAEVLGADNPVRMLHDGSDGCDADQYDTGRKQGHQAFERSFFRSNFSKTASMTITALYKYP